MKTAEYIAWYESILAAFKSIPRHSTPVFGGGTYAFYDPNQSQGWITEAGEALRAVFPAAHNCRIEWDRLIQKQYAAANFGSTFERARAVFEVAARLIKDGRIGTILDAVRVETEDELLDQATGLSRANLTVAAAVIAGGALETHLRHLVIKFDLAFSGNGSISSYDAAIAKARNDGTAYVYAATDSKLVTGWGGIRNDAAHSPTTFTRSSDEVQRMIGGIREFISRTS